MKEYIKRIWKWLNDPIYISIKGKCCYFDNGFDRIWFPFFTISKIKFSRTKPSEELNKITVDDEE